MQPIQNITVDDRVSRTQYQYTLEDPDANELNLWTGRLVEKMKQLPQLSDVATDQQTGGLAVSLVIDRATASRLASPRPQSTAHFMTLTDSVRSAQCTHS